MHLLLSLKPNLEATRWHGFRGLRLICFYLQSVRQTNISALQTQK
jgi:hypothetical protein